MSYRERLFTITKEDYKLYKDLSVEEMYSLYNVSPYEFYYDVLNPKQLHEFGNNTSQTIRKNNFFKKINQSDYDLIFTVVTKKSLIQIINSYVKIIKDSHQKLFDLSLKLDEKDEKALYIIKSDILRRRNEWYGILDMKLNNNNVLLDSWLKEYDVFNLLFILKTIDWDNNVLCLYGA